MDGKEQSIFSDSVISTPTNLCVDAAALRGLPVNVRERMRPLKLERFLRYLRTLSNKFDVLVF